MTFELADGTVRSVSASNLSMTFAGNVAQYVSATVDGANVSVTQSDEVGDATCGEIVYVLSGESADGSFHMDGSYKAGLELRGLCQRSSSGPAIDVQNGKRIEISVKSGSLNIAGTGDDGIQTDFKDSADREAEDTGTITIAGGKLQCHGHASRLEQRWPSVTYARLQD